ncbi:MAG: GDP-mannose 4,6-dehydratase [Syntrophus sp. (in: bacteria)]|nr:GDP-mannose 4,6-dehydratase [Syntrophus sp. (in: bacteria)]
MDRYLITGFSGFVSRHFLEYLEILQSPVSILGIDIFTPDFGSDGMNYVQVDFQKMDLLDREGIEKIISQFQPNYILHLASYSSVAFSWENPVKSFQNNTNIFLNVLEAVHSVNPAIRILSVGSSEEYGALAGGNAIFREEDALHPVSPYAVARVSQEMLSKVYAKGYGLDIVMTRSFNHIGPGQKEIFVISSFAKRLVEMKKRGDSSPKLMTGDISLIRDFVDVRDVVRAYDGLLKKGRKGEIYNVCGGVGHPLRELVQQMASILDMEVLTEVDERLIRPNDNKVIIGSNEKIKRDIGWTPEIPLRRSLEDVINFWNRQ